MPQLQLDPDVFGLGNSWECLEGIWQKQGLRNELIIIIRLVCVRNSIIRMLIIENKNPHIPVSKMIYNNISIQNIKG